MSHTQKLWMMGCWWDATYQPSETFVAIDKA